MRVNSYLGLSTIVVRDYDEAIAYYCGVLGFELREDIYQADQDKRWVVVAPFHSDALRSSSGLLLAQAKNESEKSRIGNQTGGRVSFFLYVDDFDTVYNDFLSKNVHFQEAPRTESYGKVVVFKDIYGNQWDLFQSSPL